MTPSIDGEARLTLDLRGLEAGGSTRELRSRSDLPLSTPGVLDYAERAPTD